MLTNVLNQPAATPFYIWANEDCANRTEDFDEAKRIRKVLINEGAEDVYIADADLRCRVVSKLGQFVEVPAELVERHHAEAEDSEGFTTPTERPRQQ